MGEAGGLSGVLWGHLVGQMKLASQMRDPNPLEALGENPRRAWLRGVDGEASGFPLLLDLAGWDTPAAPDSWVQMSGTCIPRKGHSLVFRTQPLHPQEPGTFQETQVPVRPVLCLLVTWHLRGLGGLLPRRHQS